MNYFLFSILITKFYQVKDNILYIPKAIKFYIEIPNGPYKFLEDFPILTIFENIHISINQQISFDSDDENLIDDLNDQNNHMTCIEKRNHMNILK